MTNTLAALAPVVLAGIGYAAGFYKLADSVAWWVFAIIPAFIAAFAFGHAYLGSIIGGRRANTFFVIVLMTIMFVGLWLLSRNTGSR